jgi:hypothetical protein
MIGSGPPGSAAPGGGAPGGEDLAGYDPSTYRGARPYVGAPDHPDAPDQPAGYDRPGEYDRPSEESGKPHRGIEALGAYETAQAGEDAGAYHGPGSYQGSGVYDEPVAYQGPSSDPGPGPGPAPGPGTGPVPGTGLYAQLPVTYSGDQPPVTYSGDQPPVTYSGDEPSGTEYGVLGRYNSGLYGPSDDDEPSGYLQQDTGEGPDADDYGDFWRPPSNRGGGAHASRTGPPPDPDAPPLPGAPGDTSVYKRTPVRRQAGFLLTTAIVVLVLVVVGVFFLFRSNGGTHHPTAGGSPSASKPATSAPPSSPASAPPAPPLTGADGHLGIPRSIGSLQLNALLTQKYVGKSVVQQEANSFFIPYRDVVSGFYTTDPSAASFTATEPRLMFLVSYLAGSGNAKSALHSFMTNHTFYGQYQIQPGNMGGVAACGWLAQQPSPVAHCMWADANTYADFYAWNSKPAALATTMLATRPQVELAKK